MTKTKRTKTKRTKTKNTKKNFLHLNKNKMALLFFICLILSILFMKTGSRGLTILGALCFAVSCVVFFGNFFDLL